MPFSLVRSADRFQTRTPWVTSYHSFSFGDHYDPANTHHGALITHNEERVAAGHGFDTHPHRETEIITWVTSGSLVHQDSEGHSGVIYPGLAQRMSAGTGILHSERNDAPATRPGPVGPSSPADSTPGASFIGMWILPDEHGLAPSYDQRDITAELDAGGLVPVASGDPVHDSAIRIANSGATLFAARLAAGRRVTLPSARFTHLFVTRGSVRVADAVLDAGDALRADGLGGGGLGGGGLGGDLGGEPVVGASDEGSEVLVWTMARGLGG